MNRVVVAGSGPGGLAAAIRLRLAGADVVVLEKRAEPGGKLARIEMGEHYLDAGPAALYLPQTLGDLFAAAGQRFDDSIELLPIAPARRYLFPEGVRFDFHSETDKMREEIARLDAREVRRVEGLLSWGRGVYRALAASVWKRPGGASWDALAAAAASPRALLRIHRLMNPGRFGTMVGRRLRNNAIRQAFQLFSAETGASPWGLPAAGLWLPYVIWRFGAWYPKGGFWGLRRALLRLAEQTGVEIRHGEAAADLILRKGEAAGVIGESGARYEAQAVVWAGSPLQIFRAPCFQSPDLHEPIRRAAAKALRQWERREPSLSRIGWFWACGRSWPELAHFTVLPSSDLAAEDKHLRRWSVPPPEPSIFISCPSRTDPSLSPAGKSALAVWMLAPPVSPRWRWDEAHRREARAQVLERLAAAGLEGFEESIEQEREITPEDWRRDWDCPRGACHGPAARTLAEFWRRMPNVWPPVRGLFLLNSWTHPGPLLPHLFLGAKSVAQAAEKLFEKGI